ncbi:long-wavelength rhodopsin [Elysia marginata]|uniref:Long-wavelength rhodopsin n=1 Tax=Elysia marginata TaxID=1093978 RepID=A0AAV4EMV9_9GAST|nr:long-wavelength rhodopsin [Elysia marginata]
MSELWENTTTDANRTNRTGEEDNGSRFGGNRFRFPVPDDGYYAVFDIFQMTVLTTTLVLSSIGNGFVVWTSSKNVIQRQYARLHVLLVSLALSDLLQGPCQIMPQLVRTILKTWSLGDSICRIHALTRSMLANVSVSTLAIITLER